MQALALWAYFVDLSANSGSQILLSDKGYHETNWLADPAILNLIDQGEELLKTGATVEKYQFQTDGRGLILSFDCRTRRVSNERLLEVDERP